MTLTKFRLVGYAIQSDHQHSSIDTLRAPELQWGVVYPTVEVAEDAIGRILARERRRFEEQLVTRYPSPATVKKAWDDKVGSACLVEYRISGWTNDWNRQRQPGRSYLSQVTVRIEIEQRCAWREIVQVTRTTEAGLEVEHRLGEPGPWTEWHRPFGPGEPWLPHFELAVVPHVLTVVASRRELAAWAKTAEEVRSWVLA